MAEAVHTREDPISEVRLEGFEEGNAALVRAGFHDGIYPRPSAAAADSRPLSFREWLRLFVGTTLVWHVSFSLTAAGLILAIDALSVQPLSSDRGWMILSTLLADPVPCRNCDGLLCMALGDPPVPQAVVQQSSHFRGPSMTDPPTQTMTDPPHQDDRIEA